MNSQVALRFHHHQDGTWTMHDGVCKPVPVESFKMRQMLSDGRLVPMVRGVYMLSDDV